MNINLIKDKLILLSKDKVRVKVYLGRNKYEHFIGYLENFYNNIFTIKTDSGIKSFTYSDVLIKNVIISKI